jgi:hypothetical protein
VKRLEAEIDNGLLEDAVSLHPQRGRPALLQRQHDLSQSRMAARRSRGRDVDPSRGPRRTRPRIRLRVVVESRRGAIVATVEPDPGAQRGVLALPHGYGMKSPDADGLPATHGPVINRLTASDYCDPIAKTPYHKNVPVRIRPAEAADLANVA